MSKQLFPSEIAEIVTGLLVCPDAFGELDSSDQHSAFIREIASVVSQFCGGTINGVEINDDVEAAAGQKWLVSVGPDDSLPCLNQNVWAYYDKDGWDTEATTELEDLNAGEALSDREIRAAKERVMSSLIESSTQASTRLTINAVDWNLAESGEVGEPGDEQGYSVNMTLGNQSYIDVVDADGEIRMGVIVEIDRGVPTIHLSADGDENMVHIHAAHGGLVISPGSDSNKLNQSAPFDRYSYFDKNSILVK